MQGMSMPGSHPATLKHVIPIWGKHSHGFIIADRGWFQKTILICMCQCGNLIFDLCKKSKVCKSKEGYRI